MLDLVLADGNVSGPARWPPEHNKSLFKSRERRQHWSQSKMLSQTGPTSSYCWSSRQQQAAPQLSAGRKQPIHLSFNIIQTALQTRLSSPLHSFCFRDLGFGSSNPPKRSILNLSRNASLKYFPNSAYMELFWRDAALSQHQNPTPANTSMEQELYTF